MQCANYTYDEATEMWQFGVLNWTMNYHQCLVNLPFLRAVCYFKDRPGADFLLVYPWIYPSDGHEVCYRLDQGCSKFVAQPAEGWQADAEAFLNTLCPQDSGY